jgi:hypothetical protein
LLPTSCKPGPANRGIKYGEGKKNSQIDKNLVAAGFADDIFYSPGSFRLPGG